MSAVPATKPTKSDPSKFLESFEKRYFDLIAAARKAAEATACPAWQDNYALQTDSHRKAVALQRKTIESACEVIKARDTDEDTEKEIKDAVKVMGEERIRFGAWKARAVMPYAKLADDCRLIREDAIRNARNEEQVAPLVYKGLGQGVADLVKSWPVPAWDEDKGVLTTGE